MSHQNGIYRASSRLTHQRQLRLSGFTPGAYDSLALRQQQQRLTAAAGVVL